MRFRLSSIFVCVLVVAVLFAWWKDRTTLRNESMRVDQQAAQLAEELYRLRLSLCYQEPYGGFFPPGLRAVYTRTGDVLDITTATGRDEMRQRLARGETNFRIKTAADRILEAGDIQPRNMITVMPGRTSGPANQPPAVVGNALQ